MPKRTGGERSMLLKRILGALMLLVAILGLVLGVAGMIYGRRLVDSTANRLYAALDLTSQSLDTASETLLVARTTVGQIDPGLETTQTIMGDASQHIRQ